MHSGWSIPSESPEMVNSAMIDLIEIEILGIREIIIARKRSDSFPRDSQGLGLENRDPLYGYWYDLWSQNQSKLCLSQISNPGYFSTLLVYLQNPPPLLSILLHSDQIISWISNSMRKRILKHLWLMTLLLSLFLNLKAKSLFSEVRSDLSSDEYW